MDGSDCSSLEVPSLPDDAVVQILSRLRAKALCRSKCVSKPWRDLIADRLGCKDLPQSLQGFLYFDRGSRGGGDGNGSSHGDGDAEGASGRDGMLIRHGNGRFINLLGNTMPLLDPSFAFLKEQPGIQAIELLDSCSGLLLFGHSRVSDTYDSLGYIVCNPVTEQWVAVPSTGWTPTPPQEVVGEWEKDVCTFLIFDPSVSSHFDLVQFWQNRQYGVFYGVECVHTYSSVTGLWSSEWRSDTRSYVGVCDKTLVNGMLHILVHQKWADGFEIVALDSQGRTCRIIEWPDQRGYPSVGSIGHSQGRLHCISTSRDGSGSRPYGLSIWVLEDYKTEEWVLKHSLRPTHLFEGANPWHYEFVGLHTDCNMMFFVHCGDRKLISYDMDSREVRVLCTTSGHGSPCVTPYVPSLQSL